MAITYTSNLLVTSTQEEKMQWINENPHICIYPWQNLSVQTDFNGSHDVGSQVAQLVTSCCCNLLVNNQDNNITEVKESIRAGKLHPSCEKCHMSEKIYSHSERIAGLANISPDDLLSFVKTELVSYHTLSIKFSNLCNLSCRSCSPTFSSKYAQTYNLTVPQNLFTDLADDNIAWDQIIDYLKTIQSESEIVLSLRGGESLIQPGAIKLFNWLRSTNLLSKTNLDVTTNFINLNTPVVKLFNEFKSVTMHASIDSIYENFEYTRWPGKFNQVTENLNFLLANKKINFIVQPLWNLNNIFYILDYFNWWKEWSENYNYPIIINNINMHRPYHLTIENLPIEYRPRLLELIKKILNHPLANNNVLQNYFNGVHTFLESEQVVYDQFELFLYETARQDIVNSTSFELSNKKFYNILSNNHKTLYNYFKTTQDINVLPVSQQLVKYRLPL